jgi:gliding motility-associated lipoprotein GldH
MIKGINNSSLILILTSLALSLSCKRDIVYSDTFTIQKETWDLTQIPSFNINIEDTISANNIYFMLRTGSDYPYRNIYFFVSTELPDGKTITDTMHYNLADEKGNWYGKGFGDVHSLDLPYKSNIYFPLKGNYLFKIQHGMRIENLKGVYDIGVKIQKIQK